MYSEIHQLMAFTQDEQREEYGQWGTMTGLLHGSAYEYTIGRFRQTDNIQYTI